MTNKLNLMDFVGPPRALSRLRAITLGIALGLVLSTACVPVNPATSAPDAPPPTHGVSPQPDEGGRTLGQTPDARLPGRREDRLAPAIPTQLERVIPPDETPVTGEVPVELLEAVLTDLEGRLQVERVEITILRAEQVLWPDGSLGCPQPGQSYTQAQVEGYRVVLQVGSSEYDYRLTQAGFIMLCEGSLLPP